MTMNPFLPIPSLNPLSKEVEDEILININHVSFIRKDKSTGETIIMIGCHELRSSCEYELIKDWFSDTYIEHNEDFLSEYHKNQKHKTDSE